MRRVSLWLGVVDGYGCISESVSTFGIVLVVIMVQLCSSRSV